MHIRGEVKKTGVSLTQTLLRDKLELTWWIAVLMNFCTIRFEAFLKYEAAGLILPVLPPAKQRYKHRSHVSDQPNKQYKFV